jgi:hypothetical protein
MRGINDGFLMMSNCRCRDCQLSSGAPFASVLIVPEDAENISGES